MTDALKVGISYVLKGENIGFGYTRFPIKFICRLIDFGFHDDKNHMFITASGEIVFLNNWETEQLKKLPDEGEAVSENKVCTFPKCNCVEDCSCKQKELKLEVGKKYNLENYPYDNPCKFIAIDDGVYVFRNKLGLFFGSSVLGGIKEHPEPREPHKHVTEVYVVFNPNGKPADHYDADMVTGLCTNDYFYDTEQEAEEALDHQYTQYKKLRITTEEATD